MPQNLKNVGNQYFSNAGDSNCLIVTWSFGVREAVSVFWLKKFLKDKYPKLMSIPQRYVDKIYNDIWLLKVMDNMVEQIK